MMRTAGIFVVCVVGLTGYAAAAEPRGYEVAKSAFDRKDYSTALEACRIDAKKGEPQCLNVLGVMFNNGLGVPRDVNQALHFFRTAANQGNAKAQYNLAQQFYKGEGVNRDFEQAFALFLKSAEQGLGGAQFMLGQMYALGQGTPKDVQRAIVWLTKVTEQNNPEIPESIKSAAAKNIQQLARQVAPAQTTEKPKHEPPSIVPNQSTAQRSAPTGSVEELAKRAWPRMKRYEEGISGEDYLHESDELMMNTSKQSVQETCRERESQSLCREVDTIIGAQQHLYEKFKALKEARLTEFSRKTSELRNTVIQEAASRNIPPMEMFGLVCVSRPELCSDRRVTEAARKMITAETTEAKKRAEARILAEGLKSGKIKPASCVQWIVAANQDINQMEPDFSVSVQPTGKTRFLIGKILSQSSSAFILVELESDRRLRGAYGQDDAQKGAIIRSNAKTAWIDKSKITHNNQIVMVIGNYSTNETVRLVSGQIRSAIGVTAECISPVPLDILE